jgi:hypothetical protein
VPTVPGRFVWRDSYTSRAKPGESFAPFFRNAPKIPSFKAWTYSKPGYPSTLELTEITVPPHPKPNETHVRVQAAALNPVDIQIMNVPVWNVPGLRKELVRISLVRSSPWEAT